MSKLYITPRTDIFRLMTGSCMQAASPAVAPFSPDPADPGYTPPGGGGGGGAD